MINWRKRVVSEDVISYEKKKKHVKVVIEARHNPDKSWDIFKIYRFNENNYVEEYSAESKRDAEMIISRLKSEKDLTLKQINNISKIKKNISLNIKRIYKTDSVEKWGFKVNGESVDNFFILYHQDDVVVDIIANEKYKLLENEIIDEIANVMNFEGMEGEIIQNIYFYSKKGEYYSTSSKKDKIVLGEIMFGFQDNI